PDYTGQKVCGLTVHFLPCDELQVTTSCHAYGSPEYPIKTPLHLPEPQSYPK
ncbi:Lipoprotein, partial [Pseudomonas syringae pv. theae]